MAETPQMPSSIQKSACPDIFSGQAALGIL